MKDFEEMIMRATGRKVSLILLLAVAIPAFATPAWSAGLWILPDPPSGEAGQEITVRLFEGQPFQGEERAYRAGREVRFQRLWKKGRQNLSAALFRPSEAGVQLVGYSSPATGDYCKALMVTGEAGRDDPIRWSELGQRLEIVPQSDPVVLLQSGGMLQVQVLFEREPLAGARVTAIPEAAPVEGGKKGRTDEIGLVSFRLDQPGLWMIKVERPPLSATLVLEAGGVRTAAQ
jgi:hypothetical protein